MTESIRDGNTELHRCYELSKITLNETLDATLLLPYDDDGSNSGTENEKTAASYIKNPHMESNSSYNKSCCRGCGTFLTVFAVCSACREPVHWICRHCFRTVDVTHIHYY